MKRNKHFYQQIQSNYLIIFFFTKQSRSLLATFETKETKFAILIIYNIYKFKIICISLLHYITDCCNTLILGSDKSLRANEKEVHTVHVQSVHRKI